MLAFLLHTCFYMHCIICRVYLHHPLTSNTPRTSTKNRARLQDCGGHLAAHAAKQSIGTRNNETELLAVDSMALAQDVGTQPDWHGQDCFMGIGSLLSMCCSRRLNALEGSHPRWGWGVQMKLEGALFLGPWSMGVPTAHSG